MTKANVIIEGYWSNSLMNGAFSMWEGYAGRLCAELIAVAACYNGGKICRRNVTESAGQGTAKVRSSIRN